MKTSLGGEPKYYFPSILLLSQFLSLGFDHYQNSLFSPLSSYNSLSFLSHPYPSSPSRSYTLSLKNQNRMTPPPPSRHCHPFHALSRPVLLLSILSCLLLQIPIQVLSRPLSGGPASGSLLGPFTAAPPPPIFVPQPSPPLQSQSSAAPLPTATETKTIPGPSFTLQPFAPLDVNATNRFAPLPFFPHHLALETLTSLTPNSTTQITYPVPFSNASTSTSINGIPPTTYKNFTLLFWWHRHALPLDGVQSFFKRLEDFADEQVIEGHGDESIAYRTANGSRLYEGFGGRLDGAGGDGNGNGTAAGSGQEIWNGNGNGNGNGNDDGEDEGGDEDEGAAYALIPTLAVEAQANGSLGEGSLTWNDTLAVTRGLWDYMLLSQLGQIPGWGFVETRFEVLGSEGEKVGDGYLFLGTAPEVSGGTNSTGS